MSELTGLPVSNASLYEGPSAVGSAAYLAKLTNGRGEIVVSRGVHPHSRETLATLAPGYGQRVVEAPLRDGVTDLAELGALVGPDTAVVIVQQPNFLGAVEDLEPLIAAAREAGALAVVACDPLPLALLRTPGELGADVAVGEGQSLGNRLDYGGPSFGFMAAREEHIRRMPGRIAGETRDVDGRRGFVLTLQTREQHIRRERATHNICTAQVLNALAGVVYLSWLGKRGAVELAELMLRRADYARTTLAALPGVRALHEQPVAREFALALEAPVEAVIERCAAEGVNPGLALGRDYPEHPDGLLVAITERRSRADIDRLADVLRPRGGGRALGPARRRDGGGGVSVQVQTPQQREPATTIYERSRPGRRAFVAPALDVPERPLDELLPARLRRAAPPELPEVAEPEIVRHYNRLSKRNFDLDTGFYPLGSCTMKHNPKLHERVAALPGHARLHPFQAPRAGPGGAGADVEPRAGARRGLGPAARLAAAQRGLARRACRRAAHAAPTTPTGATTRTLVLTPDTAHGTNPATVTMAGYEVVKVGTSPSGGVDLDDLRRKADDRVACLMLTNPNTLGIFDPNIEEIARIVHDAGATLYYDGANLNAVMGISRPGDMGFDIVHFNLHKSFTQPHGGGGPGAGPIAVSDRIEPYLMVPRIVRSEGANGDRPAFDLDEERPKSIGRLRGFQGNYGVFVRSYAYICSLGAEGLREASRDRRAERQLPAGAAAAAGGGRAPAARLRGALHARVRALGRADEGRPRDPHDRPGQAPAGLRLPPADGLLPAAGGGGPAGRADRDRDPRDARGLRRGRRRDPARGGRRPRDRPPGALLHPGAAPRRGRRRPNPGRPPASPRRAGLGCRTPASWCSAAGRRATSRP